MRAKFRARFPTRLPIALVAALLTVGLAAIDVGLASAGPTASVAKKKCSKKKRKKGKCGKSTGDPVAALTTLFSGSSFSSSAKDNSPSVDGSFTDVYKFCRNGTYQGRDESIGTIRSDPPIPYDYVITWGGTWKFTDALRRKTGELKGGLLLTIDSWQSNVPEGNVGHDPPPSPDSETVVVPVAQPWVVIGDHPVWTPTPGGAGC